MASASLSDAAKEGLLALCELLVKAGARADWRTATGALDGKTALHFACEAGHENVASLLILSIPKRERVYLKTTLLGLDPLELARACDFGGMARRLQELVDARVDWKL